MTGIRGDYARTDELDNALIPLEQVREKFGISNVTLWRRMKAAGVEPVFYGAASYETRGRSKALRWADVVVLLNLNP